MTDSLYNLYHLDTIKLVRTLIIKSDAVAAAINKELAHTTFVDVDSPHTWKYYLNLNGQYHQTDVDMTITSLDNLETIPFTKEALTIHRTTKKLYTFNSDLYKDLIERYPYQRILINGILWPVDLDTAIDSPDYTVLYHDPDLIESNEVNLLSDIQTSINQHMLRWDNISYRDTDDLYVASCLAVMIAALPNEILNLRLAKCKTDEVHTYHLWTYLRSKSGLDKYRRSLTHKQALFLYRNIEFIQRNSGKTSTFNLLIERILTERNIPLFAYDIRHSLESQPDQLRPDIEMQRYPLNLPDAIIGVTNNYTVPEVLDKTQHLATENWRNKPQISDAVIYSTQTSGQNNLNTKLLESIITDTSDLYGLSLTGVLVEHWVMLAAEGIYVGNLIIPNPHTGENLQLTPLDAFTLYMHVWNKTIGSNLDHVPKIVTLKTIRFDLPTMTEVRTVIEDKFLDETVLLDLLDMLPTTTNIINADTFYEYCMAVYTVYNKMTDIYMHDSSLHGHAQLHEVLNLIQTTREIELSPIETYDEWLFSNDIELGELSLVDATLLSDALIDTATGLNSSEVLTPSKIQSDLLDVMSLLTSYDLQFIRSMVGSDAYVIPLRQFRISEPMTVARHFIDNMDFALRVIESSASAKLDPVPIEVPILEITDTTILYDYHPIDVSLDLVCLTQVQTVENIILPNLHLIEESVNVNPI